MSTKEDLLENLRKTSSNFKNKIKDRNRMEAEIELTYILAAIQICKGSNDIGCEIHIGQLTKPIGISLNSRLIPILEEEAEEIRKYLRGEPNNYDYDD